MNQKEKNIVSAALQITNTQAVIMPKKNIKILVKKTLRY